MTMRTNRGHGNGHGDGHSQGQGQGRFLAGRLMVWALLGLNLLSGSSALGQ